ncbi:MAG: type II secretion system protein [bacterium]
MEEEKRRITLVEIMIGVVILFLLSVIVPGFLNLQGGIKRATTKGHLNVVRKALQHYYYKNSGTYPEKLDELVPVYIGKIPIVNLGFFFRYEKTTETTDELTDSGKWYYNHETGEIHIDCFRKDENGTAISSW